MQVRAGRAAGRADVADDVAALDRVAGLDVIRAQVPVARRQAEGVLEDDQVAVVARVARRLDDAVGGGVDRLALFRGDVDALSGTPGSPVNGSLRPPKKPVSQPCVGQMDGVAAASCSRRSTSRCTKFRRLSRPCSRSRSAPNVSSGEARPSRTRSTRWRAASSLPGRRRALTHGAGSFAIARAARDRARPRAEIVDDAFERLNLRGELAGRRAIARVLRSAALRWRREAARSRTCALSFAPRP